jgi:hypothetical protein
MYNFELIIRGKTEFEKNEEEENFDIKKIEVSGVCLVKANTEGEYRLPFLNRDHIKFWMGRFTQGVSVIEVRDVVLLKIENFPRYPILDKPNGKTKNRVSITKIHKSKRKFTHVPDGQ